MIENFSLDALCEYGTEPIPGTMKPVVNPVWRELDRRHKSIKSKIRLRQSRCFELSLHPKATEVDIQKWEGEKAKLVEELDHLHDEAKRIKDELQSVPDHVSWEDLPENEKCEQLATGRKRLVSTVSLVAYRAETAMATLIRTNMSHPNEARSLIRSIFTSDADIIPDYETKTLHVRLHTLATPRDNRTVSILLDHLNSAELIFPGTDLRLCYSLVGPPLRT
jgi:hypothetical protein